jgi:hypothetical protein
MSELPEVDWGVFRKWPKPAVECRCGATYASYAKLVKVGGGLEMMCEDECPSCGRRHGNARSVKHVPEAVEIRG